MSRVSDWSHHRDQSKTRRSINTSHGPVFWHLDSPAIVSRVHLVGKIIGFGQLGRNDFVLIRIRRVKSGTIDAEGDN